MIDLHCHLLPGIDDGPATIGDAIEQARLHVAAGVTTVACTPHVSQSHYNDANQIAVGVSDLDRALHAAGVDLTVLPGAEVSVSRALDLSEDELAALHLGESEWLLVEPPLGSELPRLAEILRGLHGRGHRVLVAHPERCAAFHRDPALLESLVRFGARAQITATSFTGQFGRTVDRLARDMLAAGLVHVVASDAHDTRNRPPGLAEPLAAAGLDSLTEWACEQVPSALLRGGDLPPAPPLPSRRRGLFRRG